MSAIVETATEARQKRRLWLVFALVSAFVPFEFFGAHTSESNVLLADALHLVMDILALAASIFAMHLSLRPPTDRFPFGFRRAEPIAAAFNGILVLLATLLIVREGIEQLREGHVPLSKRMLVFSVAGLCINGISAWLLHDSIHAHGHGHSHGGHDHDHGGHGHSHSGHAHAHEGSRHKHGGAHHHAHEGHGHSHDEHAHAHEGHAHGHDGHADEGAEHAEGAPRHPHDDHDEGAGHALNLRSARLHLIGDTLGSLAALVAAIVIHFGGPAALDPIASFFVAGILIIGAARVLRDAVLILLEASPPRLPRERFVRELAEFSRDVQLKDVRTWSIGAGHDAACITVSAKDPVGGPLAAHLRQHLGLAFVSVQVEPEEPPTPSPAE